jgi:hypothetical protein
MPGRNNTKVYYKLEKDQMVITLAGLGGDLKCLEESLNIYKDIYEDKFQTCNEGDFKIVPLKDDKGNDVEDKFRQQFYIQLPDKIICVHLGGQTEKPEGKKCHIKLGEILYNTHARYGERIISIAGIPDLNKMRLKRELDPEFIQQTLRQEIEDRQLQPEIFSSNWNKTGTDRPEHMVWVDRNAKTFLTYLKENLFTLEYIFLDKLDTETKWLLDWLVLEKILKNSPDNPNKYLCTNEALERLTNIPQQDVSAEANYLYNLFSPSCEESFEYTFKNKITDSQKNLLNEMVRQGVLTQDSSDSNKYTITKAEVQKIKAGQPKEDAPAELVQLYYLFCSFLPDKPFEFTLHKPTYKMKSLLFWLMNEKVVTPLDRLRYSFTKDALQRLGIPNISAKIASLCKKFQTIDTSNNNEVLYANFCKLPQEQQQIHYGKWMFANSCGAADLWEDIKHEFRDKNDNDVLTTVQYYFTSPDSRYVKWLKKGKMAVQIGSTLYLPHHLTGESFKLPIAVPNLLSSQAIKEIFGQNASRDSLSQANDESVEVETLGQFMVAVNLWYQCIVDHLYPSTNSEKSSGKLDAKLFKPAIKGLVKLCLPQTNNDGNFNNEAIEPLPLDVMTKLLAMDDFREQSVTEIVSAGIKTAYPVAAIQNSNGGPGKILYVKTPTGDKPSAVSFTQENGITCPVLCYWDGSVSKVVNAKDLKFDQGINSWNATVGIMSSASTQNEKHIQVQRLPGRDSQGNLFGVETGERLTETNPEYYVGWHLNGLETEIFNGISNIPEAEQPTHGQCQKNSLSFGDNWTITKYKPGRKPGMGKFSLHRQGNEKRMWTDPDGKVVGHRTDVAKVPEERIYAALGAKPEFKLSSAKRIQDSLQILASQDHTNLVYIDSSGERFLTQIKNYTTRAEAYERMWQQFTEKHDSALDVAKALIADYRDHSLQNDDEIVAEVASVVPATPSNGTGPEIPQIEKGIIARFISKIKNILKSFGHWGRHHHQDAVDLLKDLNTLSKNANDHDIYRAIVSHRGTLLKRNSVAAIVEDVAVGGAAAVSKPRRPELKQGGSYDARLSTLIVYFGSRSPIKTIQPPQEEGSEAGHGSRNGARTASN